MGLSVLKRKATIREDDGRWLLNYNGVGPIPFPTALAAYDCVRRMGEECAAKGMLVTHEISWLTYTTRGQREMEKVAAKVT